MFELFFFFGLVLVIGLVALLIKAGVFLVLIPVKLGFGDFGNFGGKLRTRRPQDLETELRYAIAVRTQIEILENHVGDATIGRRLARLYPGATFCPFLQVAFLASASD